jgi:hypothetical protein
MLKTRLLTVNIVVIKLYPGYNWGMGNRPKRAESALIDGTKVRGHRERAGLTQDLLAAEVTRLGWHLSQGYLPSLEKKPTARVHKQLAVALATVLGITADELRAAVPQGHRGKQGSGQQEKETETVSNDFTFGDPHSSGRKSKRNATTCADTLKDVLQEIDEISKRLAVVKRVVEAHLSSEEQGNDGK